MSVFYVVSYDIIDDRTRDRVAKILKGVGERVQKSVFECPELTQKRFLELKLELEQLINLTEDSIRYYRQCRHCLRDLEISGIGTLPTFEDYKVVY